MPGVSKNSSSKNIASEEISEELLEKMRQLNEKLLALDYSREFVSNYKCPPIHRYFFCKQINQAQQFFAFCCLSSYLLSKLNNGRQEIKVDSFDDPNLTIDKIIGASQPYGIGDVSKNRLKIGYGAEVITLLSILTDKLFSERYQNQEANIEIIVRSGDGSRIEVEEDDDEDYIEDEDQENEIVLEEEFEDYLETESDLVVHDGDDEEWQDTSLETNQQQLQRQMIQATEIDLSEWKLELERILPQMNAHRFMKNQSKDRMTMFMATNDMSNEWRIHLQAARRHHTNIETIFSQTEGMLTKIEAEMKTSMEKIAAKESYLHQNCNTILAEYINVRQRAIELKQSLDQAESELEARSLRLQELNEEDRSTKQSIEEFSLRMTDSSPLAEAKKAREMLKQEMIRISLQIGVAIQILVRHVSAHSSY
ncbi:intraflagellar transport 57 [Dermatophagoides pteronyssinus]|uniref:Intraflagellar transport protein 57 n=2 Tax=Dermatophagoides pteronyssinus TaxID=6956 RepID=A0ABQ8IZU7_DERPT|nr:intraflagellar transport protein 57 homolog [Dermatophagoides pteronyssinus]KAH9415795.1 Intraflagellar transport protein 57 [Dermatophagoides pteronyssinus]